MSQNPYYITIDNTSGLPYNSVYDIFQDSKGFMWFATGKGLCRYDGNFIKVFTSDIQTSKSGSCIQEDKFGRIWYENFDGFLYYVENEQLKSLQQDEPLGYFRYGITNKHLLVLEADGVQVYDLKTLQPLKKIALKFSNLMFVYSTKNKLYIFADKLYVVDEFGNTNTNFYPENFTKEFNSPIVEKTENGIVIISKFSNNYYYLKEEKFEKQQFNFPTEFIQNLATINDDIWLCSTKGITRLNTKTLSQKKYFTDKNISFIYLDKQNNYWISTINEGVYFIENFDTKIIEIPSKPIVFSKSKKELLVGVENDALYAINPENYNYKTIYKGNLNHGINQLYYDKESDVTFLTSTQFKVIAKNRTIELGFGAVKSITRIDSKYFSYAASNVSGVFTNNPSLKSSWDAVFKDYPTIFSTKNIARKNLIANANGKSTVYNSNNQTIYYATNNGLIAFSKNKQREIKFKNQTLYFTKIAYYNGNIYGFSSNEKAYFINSNNIVKPYLFLNKIITNKIERISIENQFLFAFSSDAIYEINLDTNITKKIITLTKDITISDVKILNNQYYFASSKGIIVKNRIETKANLAPKLFINQIEVNDEKINTKSNIELDHTQKNIKINFTVLSFIPNEKFKVLYKINNSKWNQLDPENRNLILSSLSPNDYEIKLKIDDKKCKSIAIINFTINKPIWLNPAVLIVFGLILLVSIHLFYKSQIAKLEKQNQLALEKVNLEKNVNQSKLKAIKSQMNPHFFYNALNTIQSFILSNDKKQAVNYLSKFSVLTRTILEMTEKETIIVAEEVKALSLYLDIEKARFEEDFSYEILVDKEFDIENSKIPSMLLQPYVENAVKHGLLHKNGIKKITIYFIEEDDLLKITIDDNGIGRQKSGELNAIKNKNHQSFATEAIQSRVELLNKYNQKNISIRYIDKINPNKLSSGTTVIFEIPITY